MQLEYVNKKKFEEICPMMLFNFEIGNCRFDDGEKGLNRNEG